MLTSVLVLINGDKESFMENVANVYLRTNSFHQANKAWSSSAQL